jgi:hypothetical protein
MALRSIFTLVLALWVCGTALGSVADDKVRISELTNSDRDFMSAQRAGLEDMAERNFGSKFSGDRDRDLQLLQNLLDKRLVRPDQTRELQAMGVIMGELLAVDLDMHWVIYEDKLGRSRALRYKESDNFLFPMTMISRRREVGNQRAVTQIYQKAYDIIAASRPALPFQ